MIPKRRWEDNINIYIRELEYESLNWITVILGYESLKWIIVTLGYESLKWITVTQDWFQW
jgi:hypothetical protein